MNETPDSLQRIYLEIAGRTQAIASARPEWPCRKGCDTCCRRLPHPPEVTAAEWDLLYAGFRQLSPAIQVTVGRKITALPANAAPGEYLTCPFLDEDAGACLVYAHRPAACRSYGFYASRSGNQWCDQIEARVNAGMAEGVMLGNHQALTRAMAKQFGEARPITTWFGEPIELPQTPVRFVKDDEPDV